MTQKQDPNSNKNEIPVNNTIQRRTKRCPTTAVARQESSKLKTSRLKNVIEKKRLLVETNVRNTDPPGGRLKIKDEKYVSISENENIAESPKKKKKKDDSAVARNREHKAEERHVVRQIKAGSEGRCGQEGVK